MRHFHRLIPVILGTICLTATLALADGKIDPSQLVGAWVRTTAADIKGIEFTKDNKAFVYFGGGSDADTDTFSIMDDGRLNITQGGGLSVFFLPSFSGDQLQLKDPQTGNVWRYRRLNSGETMAAAIAGQDQNDQKSVQERNAALPQFLKRTDLVMVVVNGPANAPSPAALALTPANDTDFAGHICYSGTPPRIDIANARIENPDNPDVAVFFGPGTFEQPGPNGVWEFHPSGTASDMVLTSKVSFGEVFDTNAPTTVIIRADATLYKKILDSLNTEATRLNGLRAPVAALLKDYVVLTGISQSITPAQGPTADTFILSHNPQNNTWVGQGQSVNRTTGATEIFPVQAGVGIVNQKPAIQIASQKRIYQFTDIDTAGEKLTGAWQVPNNPTAHPAQFVISQAIDAKARDQLFATRKTALQRLTSNTVFHAVIDDQYGNNSQPPNPIGVTLNVGTGGAITGAANYLLEGCIMTLTGKEVDTLLGPQIIVQYSTGKPSPGAWGDAPAFIKLVQHEAWMLSPTNDSSGAMRLNGYAETNPGPTAVPFTIDLVSYTAQDKAAITEALGAGARFKVTHPQMGSDVPDSIIQFGSDPATSKITGTLASGGNALGAYPGLKFSCPIQDQPGWVALDAPIMRPNISRSSFTWKMLVTSTDGKLYINAYGYSPALGAARPIGRWDAVQVTP